jgi:hypothetical protein
LNKLDKLIQVYKDEKDDKDNLNQRMADHNQVLLEEKNLNEFLKKFVDDVDDNLIQLINQLM